MRLSKASTVIAVVNIFALLIVYQRTEAIKYSYKNKRQEDFLQRLIDRRNYLRFSLESYKSLDHIDQQLFKQASTFEMPAQKQVMVLPTSTVKRQVLPERLKSKERTVIAKALFWLEREAQAEPDQ
jgi:hypothetical protein